MYADNSSAPACLVPPGNRRRLRVLVTSTASDSHTWNLVYLQLLLEELGHDVTNIGCCVSPSLLADTCLGQNFDLVVVSSVNGHGFSDGLDQIRALRARPELRDLPVVIGGKLGTDGLSNISHTRELREAGYDGVFDTGDIGAFRSYLDKTAVTRAAS
uniref:Glutamate mutase S-chain n=1 Tax=uncultured bacterium esnapd2 TaxID=1366601 RepID=S5UBQ4_9BACT|nr:glutamate mutase S-chain [uncultured bacterium esnapd2]